MLNFIVPKFIKTFDRYLLLNRPFWYITKLHYILYFTVLMWALSFFIGSLLPINILSYNPVASQSIWIFTFSVLGVILFCVWMYHLTIYNNEDRFGRYSKFDDVKLLLVLLVGINLLMSFSYPMQLCMKSRLADILTDTELAAQYNTLNRSHKYITHEISDFQFCGYDVHKNVYYEDVKNDTNAYKDEREIRDLSKFKNFIAYYPGDNYFDRYSFSDIFFGKTSEKHNKFNSLLLTAQQIENHYQQRNTDKEILADINNTLNLCNVYGSITHFTAKNYFDDYKQRPTGCQDYMPSYSFANGEDDFEAVVDANTPLTFMNNIYEAKYERIYLLSNSYLLFAFYFSFGFSVLIIMFRNNRWQHYLVTAVSFILIGIILSIISMLFFMGNFDSVFPTLILLTWFCCLIMTIVYFFNNTKYKVVYVVASNLVFISLPFVPFLFAMYLHQVFDLYKCDYNLEQTAQQIYECNVNQILFDEMFTWTQILGIAFFILVAMPFFKILYIKQKALPKEK